MRKILKKHPSIESKFSYLQRLYFALRNNRVKRRWDIYNIIYNISTDHDMRRSKWSQREESTIYWINTFDKNSVFWDIGACIGNYSLYAAKAGHTVCAFEPVFHNFYTLNRNILLNKLDNITAYPISIHNGLDVDNLYLRGIRSSDSWANFGEERVKSCFKQGSMSLSLNILAHYLPTPNYIKIDVDGNEKLIIEGMQKLIENPNLKEILIETILVDGEPFKIEGFEVVKSPIVKKEGNTLYRRII